MPRRAASAALLASAAVLAAAGGHGAEPGDSGADDAGYQAWLAARTGRGHQDSPRPVYNQRRHQDSRLRRRALPADPPLHNMDVAAALQLHTDAKEEAALDDRTGANVEAALQLQSGAGIRQPGYVAPYVPKIGVANVTTPTAFPPPPATLDYDRDYQPLDTWIGNVVASSFVAPITITPPPTQDAVDLAFACPVLLNFPDVVKVGVYGTCDGPDSSAFAQNGNWTSTGDAAVGVVNWTMKCDPRTSSQPIVEYTLPNGDFFGQSKTDFSFMGNDMKLLDCSLNVKYTIRERVFKQEGKVNQDACTKYGSCDGTVYLQYEILDHTGKKVAITPYLTLFQDEYSISDPNGLEIARILREGQWNPMDSGCSNTTRQWRVTFNAGAPAPFNGKEKRWPIAELMTMMSHRDAYRKASGMVNPTECEIGLISGGIIAFFVIVGVLTLIACIFIQVFRPQIKERLFIFEQMLFPKYMCKPSTYEGNG